MMIKGKFPLAKKQPSNVLPEKTGNKPLKDTSKAVLLKPTLKENSRKELIPQEKQIVQSRGSKRPVETSSRITSKPSFLVQPQEELFPCKQCGRSFVKTSLKRHEKICNKIFSKKRKPFNSAKQRIAQKEQLIICKSNVVKRQEEMKQKAIIARKIEVPEWKRQSMALRMAMKQMRGGKVSEENIKEVKQIQKMEQTSMFKCKFCGKRFNDEAGLRHQKFCETKSKDMRNRTKLRCQ